MAERKKPPENDENADRDPAPDALIPAEIGKKLKTLYDDVVEEDIPDRFLDLLDKLDKSKKDG